MKNIPNFKGLYKMSKEGSIYSIKSGKTLKVTRNKRAFYNLSKNGKHYYSDAEDLFNKIYPNPDIIYKGNPLGAKAKITENFHVSDITIVENYGINLIKILESNKTSKKNKDKIMVELSSINRYLREVREEL